MDDAGIVRISRWVYNYDIDEDDDVDLILSKNVRNWDKIPQDTRDKIVDIGKTTNDVDYIKKTYSALGSREIEDKIIDSYEKPSFVKRVFTRIKSFFRRR